MNNATQVIDYLKAKGFRITNVRKAVIDILHDSSSPSSVEDILNTLKKFSLNPNKTTAYREIEFLQNHGIVQEVDFGEGLKRFEIASNEHHHHLICVKCKKVEDISLNQDLSKEEKRISTEKKYKILNHSLEFFGICGKCQKTTS